MSEQKEILYRDECYAIQGAVYEVYREMGCGFLESVKEIAPIDRAQMINYLKVTKLRLGLRINFGHHPKATIERIIL